MHKVKISLTCYLPDGLMCNVSGKEVCRFCVKTTMGRSCALYNEPLIAHSPKAIMKCKDCMTAWNNREIKDDEM